MTSVELAKIQNKDLRYFTYQKDDGEEVDVTLMAWEEKLALISHGKKIKEYSDEELAPSIIVDHVVHLSDGCVLVSHEDYIPGLCVPTT